MVDVEELRRLIAKSSRAETKLVMARDWNSLRPAAVYTLHGGMNGMNADKVASDVFYEDAMAIVAGMNALPELLTELEQLRAELLQERRDHWETAIELNYERDMFDVDALTSLRAAARALVDAMPKCSQRWWKDPRGDKTPPDAWACNDLGTHVHVGADGDESYYCKHHWPHEEAPWCHQLLALSAELGGEGGEWRQG